MKLNLTNEERLRRSQRASDRNFKHGQRGTPEYACWGAIKQRCLNKSAQAFRNYGARGITICDRWRDSFEAFLADMGPRPKGHEIDRIDNDGNYEPGNVRWVSRKTNMRNRRANRIVVVRGECLSIADAADKYGVSYRLLKQRIFYGWSGDRATFEPVDVSKRGRR